MAQLSTKIKEYTKAQGVANVDFLKDVLLRDNSDGQGVFIAEWNLDIPKPTLEQLEQYDVQADFNIAMADLRQKRNAALTRSDWSVLTDIPLNPADRSAWMNYRTLLRNLPNGLTTVEEAQAVTLPLPPK